MRKVAHYDSFCGRFCAASRALLNWSQDRLSSETGVARKTISDFEMSLRQPHARTKKDLLSAFEEHGIRFIISSE
ncbi:helix-turn-helix domain-containing protein, partial [Acetobacter cerevisiae]